CPHFRILIIGRANAGKTTILEKVCGIAQGTKPIIYNQNGDKLNIMWHKLRQLLGIHNIEHQITYPGSDFIFHDSPGFKPGSVKEMESIWKFIEKRSAATDLKDQLHAIWYCIPVDSSQPLAPVELQFFSKGTGKVPLVAIFTKFDGLVIQEHANLSDIKDWKDKLMKARQNAENTLQQVYVSRVMNTKYPPKAYVTLEDMHKPETNCHELPKKTALDAINDASLHDQLILTQMNNLDLCVKSALQHVLNLEGLCLIAVFDIVLTKFPHYWIQRNVKQQKNPNWVSDIEIVLDW
ncbi:hypothetical protein F5887DRAFT_1258347, partial [Amanita rubescens]